jgi:hypothetical protein
MGWAYLLNPVHSYTSTPPFRSARSGLQIFIISILLPCEPVFLARNISTDYCTLKTFTLGRRTKDLIKRYPLESAELVPFGSACFMHSNFKDVAP